MSKKVEVGIKECNKCEYYLRCEECVGSYYKEEIPKLNQQISDLEKALELACKWLNDYQYFDSDCPRYSDCFNVENSKFWNCSNCDCSKLAIEHFKTKAKEMMKSE